MAALDAAASRLLRRSDSRLFARRQIYVPEYAVSSHTQGEPTFEFCSAHRNTISWSPHGRFLLLAGLGNLAGEMDFWDVNRKKIMGSTSSHCAVAFGWSPDSRWFMTATCAPRMNVDNDVKVTRFLAFVFSIPRQILVSSEVANVNNCTA